MNDCQSHQDKIGVETSKGRVLEVFFCNTNLDVKIRHSDLRERCSHGPTRALYWSRVESEEGQMGWAGFSQNQTFETDFDGRF